MPARNNPRAKGSGPLLDPYGIYGTRTANRMRSMRRRRQTQNIILLLLIIGGVATVGAFAKIRRKAAVKPVAQFQLLSPVTERPVFALDQKGAAQAVLIATADGRLLDLEPSFDADSQPKVILDTAFPAHAPLIQGAIALVPCEDGALYAVNWQTDKPVWRTVLGAPLSARPTVIRLFLKDAAATPAPAATAQPATTPTPTPEPPPSNGSLRDVVVAGTDDGLLVAMRAGNGKVLWRSRLPAPLGEAIVPVGGNGRPARLLVPLLGNENMRGGLWCLDGATGKVLWRFPKDTHVEAIQPAAPVVDENEGRVFLGNDTGGVFCIDLKTGICDPSKKIGWKSFAPSLTRDTETIVSWRSAPVLFYGSERGGLATRLVIGGNDGGLRCYGAQDGRVLWQFKATGSIIGLQKLSQGGHDYILAATRTPAVYLIDALTGERVRRYNTAGVVAGAGAAGGNGEVVTVTTDGTVQRFPVTP